MRKRNSHIVPVSGSARFVPRIPIVLSFALLAPISGCMPGEAVMFIDDVKNFYLNGGLTSGATEGTADSQSGADALAVSATGPQEEHARVAPEDGDRSVSRPRVRAEASNGAQGARAPSDGEKR